MHADAKWPRRRVGDVVMAKLAGFLVRVFFRDVDTAGALPLPEGPLLVVANHVNGLVDGLVLMAGLDRYPRFLGKATLYRIPILAPFLHLAGVVPVHRAGEGGSAEANAGAFRTANDLLAAGGVVGIFPEGVSHDEARLQGLRTGAARMALGAAELGGSGSGSGTGSGSGSGSETGGGVSDVQIVAVGLVYDDKARFRSQALVRVGRPRSVEGWRGAHLEDPVAAVRALTADLADQLAEVAPMYDSRSDELAFHRLAAVAARGPDGVLDRAIQDDVARALSRAAAADPVQRAIVEDLVAASEGYAQDLAALGISDRDVLAGVSARRAAAAGSGLLVTFAAAPVALAGAALHALPYAVMYQVGRRPPNEGMRATVKLLGCTTLFTATYVTLAVVVGRRRGPLAGLAAFAAGPLAGYTTVLFTERLRRAGGMRRARRALADRRGVLAGLAARRDEIVERAADILGAVTGPNSAELADAPTH